MGVAVAIKALPWCVVRMELGDAFDHAKAQGLLKVDEVNNDVANFKKLAAGRVDCLIAIELTGEHVIHQEGYQDQIESLAQPLAVNDTHLVLPKKMGKKSLYRTI
jgi:hypothetical protein